MKELHVKVRKRSMMLFALLLLAMVVFAVPAKPGLKRLLTLTDGTTVTATLVGDEFAHYWVDGDGNTYQAAGGDVYQLVDVQAVKQRAAKRRAASNQRRMRRLAPRKVGDVGSISGSKKGLIILVNFSDVKFKTGNNNALYKRIANEENLSYGDFKGSMYDYFKAQSEGKFELTFDVVGPVNISKGQSYYGSNDKNDNDEHPAEMVIEALKKADADVDFSDYDWDDDKEVEQVYIVYAGKGEADGGEDFTIWPHEWQLSAAASYGDGAGAQTLDGVKIDTYACGGELNGVTGSIAGIGTMCHEFSHCLGYPDFYDTDYSGGQGMFQWDLMDSGSYNDDGYRPSGYTSYERWVAGWKEPVELEYTQSISNMAALQDEDSKSYIIYNKGNKNEYYLLENRQKKGWDASLPGKGLLILHVDYNKTAWEDNQPNDNPSHQRMTWIPADNEYQYTTYNGTKYYTEAGAANDPYPYGSINAFGKTTTPAAKLFNKNSDGTYYLDSSIENITQNSDGTISFDFKGKNITPTIIAEPEALTFKTAPGTPQAKTFELLSELLTEDITVTLTDANGVFSIDKTSVTTAESEEGASVTVTFSPATEGSYTGTVTLSSEGAENVVISLTATARESASNPDTKNFKLVTSVDDLEEGMRYIIACGSKETAAGALESSLLESESVTMSKDIITIGDNVTVFELEGNQTDGWTFKNESTNKYLYSTATKSLAYSNDAKTWTLSNGTAGVIMAYGTLGTMLYNSGSPRFTTYTSSPTASMIQANLYMETSEIVKKDVTMVFDPATAEATLGEDFTEPTLTTTPAGLAVTYSSSKTDVATVDPSTGKVTLVAAGETTITASFAGNDAYNEGSASYTLTVSEPLTGDDFALISSASDFVEGDYIIVYDNGAMNTTISNNRLGYTEVSPKSNVITTDDATIVWHIKPSGDYYTIYNAKANKYAASTGTKNQVQLLASGTDDMSLWSVTKGATFDFTNKKNTASSINATLRRNGTYGFACYATGTGGALSLYKRGGSGGGGGGDEPDPTTDYYKNADGKQGKELKTAMCGIIYNRTEQDYDDLWEAFKTTDVDSDGKIWDMYSNKKKYDPVSSGSSYSQEGDCYNREHSWPQSWFGSNTPMHTDLHHVYPSDGYVNGMRSNNPYGETDSPTYTSENGFSKLGPCSYPGYTGKVFEPNDEYKGDFARTYFYMVTCYEEKLPDWYTTYSSTEVTSVLDGNTYPGLSEWQLNMLMEWAQNDPVSEKEINRNNAVYGIQNNRNPFIDYPGLEEYIWGSMTTTAFSYDNYVQPVYKQPVTMSFDPATATATLGEDFTEPTLTTTPADLTVTYSSSKTDVATVDENTGKVTLVAAGTTVITASFAGNDDYIAGTASYTLTVSESSSQEEGTLLYEGLTNYSSEGDSPAELTISSDYLDSDKWSSITKVYAGGTSYAKEKGGCLKFGTGSLSGTLVTKSINLTGSGTLTFYLKKYGSDTGKLNLTVTGAKANKTQFTPSDTWSLCTVNLTEAAGSVVITFATSSKRAYVDEITLTGGSTPIVKEDVTMSFDPETAEATLGEDFTEPTLTTDPDALTVTYSSSDESVATVDENTGKVTLVAAGETTITATFAGNDYYNENSASYTLTVSESTTPVVGSGKYEKVTDASTLKAGDKILIAYINEDEETQVVLSTTQNTNNRAAASITVNADGTLSPDDNAQVITLEKDGDNYLFNVGTDGYLYAASSSKNWLMTEKTADANAKAAISISEDDATIEFQGSNSRKYLRYNENSGSPIFSCYASTSTVVTLPQIYREVNTTPAVLIGDANGDGQVTITDAVAIVDYILGNEPENFNKAAANVSGDFDDEGEPIVNITDAVGVVDIILNQE